MLGLFIKRGLEKGIIDRAEFISDFRTLKVEITKKIIGNVIKRVKDAVRAIKE